MKFGILVGSLRRESFSRQIADNIAKLLPADIEAVRIDLDMPIYNQDADDDGTPPQAWTTFRATVKACDAFLFVTPEYNRSLPPLLKNALDVGSRPYGANVWGGKKGGVVSVSPGAIGGFGANHALRQVAVCLDLTLMAQPEMYVGNVMALLDEAGNTDERTTAHLQNFVARLVDFLSE